MITGKEVKVLDKNAEFFGTPQEKLMEEAGRQLALFIEETFTNPSIAIFCGIGNNGGDGFVAARYLSKNHPVTLFLVGEEKQIHTSIALMNFTKLKQLPLKIYDIRYLSKIDSIIDKATIIIDAILGVGLTGNLREPHDEIVQKINNSKNKMVVACDVPTGMGLNTTILANHTVTFHDKKEGMEQRVCGKIHIKTIGIPEKASIYVGPGELSEYYPRPKKESHKGQNGRVLIIGGGPFTGAPALSALASLRTGADLVTVAVPKNIVSTVAAYSPNIIVRPLNSENHLSPVDTDVIKDLCSKIDAVLIGPGLGLSTETIESVQIIVDFLSKNDIPFIVDADGITALSKHHEILKKSRAVITPHAREFYTFTGELLQNEIKNQIEQVTNWAQKLGIGIFVKGPTDIISDGTITRLNMIHNEAMTVGGTGDVLAGVIAGLLSKHTSIINAMRIAAFISGEAGNIAFNQLSYGMCATDVIDNIPKVLKRYL